MVKLNILSQIRISLLHNKVQVFNCVLVDNHWLRLFIFTDVIYNLQVIREAYLFLKREFETFLYELNYSEITKNLFNVYDMVANYD